MFIIIKIIIFGVFVYCDNINIHIIVKKTIALLLLKKKFINQIIFYLYSKASQQAKPVYIPATGVAKIETPIVATKQSA